MATFYDTHAHLDYPDYEKDLPEVIARAQNAGIAKIISIGTSLASSERAIRLAERIPNVFAAVGWHPSEAMKAPADLRPALRELAKHPKVVAIGEIGLDYHHLPSAGGAHGPRHPMSGGVTRPASPPDTDADARYKQRQAELFAQQLEVAVEAGLNCVIHQRDAFDDTLAQLKPFAGKTRG
ncbi:MAG: TatD family hydrolase, partial [Verrucomicrobiota bacterium]